MRVTLRVLLAVVVVAACGAACSAGGQAATNGPLDASGDPGTQCVPQPTNTPVTFGLNTIRNAGDTSVQIQSVKLNDSEGLKLLDAKILVLSPTQRNLVGIWGTYPPTDEQLQNNGITWSSLRNATAVRIGPGATANLVLEISRSSASIGSATSTEIDYTADKKTYRATTNTAIRLVPSAQC